MTHEFDAVRASFASSLPGRFAAAVSRAVTSAWRTSTAGAVARSGSGRLMVMPAPSVIQIIAIAIAMI
jgi:hypothetical protein